MSTLTNQVIWISTLLKETSHFRSAFTENPVITKYTSQTSELRMGDGLLAARGM